MGMCTGMASTRTQILPISSVMALNALALAPVGARWHWSRKCACSSFSTVLVSFASALRVMGTSVASLDFSFGSPAGACEGGRRCE